MERRRILRLLTSAATGLWATTTLPSASLEAAVPNRASQDSLVANIPLFPLPLVLFPETNLPLHIFEPRYKEMIQDCLENGWEFGILLDQEGSVRNTGCTASISEVLDTFPDGRMNILVRGQRRFEVSMFDEERSYLRGKPQFLGDLAGESVDSELQERGVRLNERLRELIRLENEPFHTPPPVRTDTQLSYRIMAGVPAVLDWKQDLLELRSESERLVRVVSYFEQLIERLGTRPDSGSQIVWVERRNPKTSAARVDDPKISSRPD